MNEIAAVPQRAKMNEIAAVPQRVVQPRARQVDPRFFCLGFLSAGHPEMVALCTTHSTL